MSKPALVPKNQPIWRYWVIFSFGDLTWNDAFETEEFSTYATVHTINVYTRNCKAHFD